jgi:predicted phosphodiesterase
VSAYNDAQRLADLKRIGAEADGTPTGSHRPPQGWEPGIAWDGTNGTLTTGPMTGPPAAWGDILKVWNLDPAEVEIVEPVQLRAWDAQTKEGIQRMFYYRVQIRRRREGLDLTELLETITKWKPGKTPEVSTGGLAYVVAYADLQIGKIDGEGTEGTVRRVLEKTDAAVARLKELRKAGRQIDTVYLAYLGDCIEGFESQGGRLAWRTDLTLTEMVRVYRRLILHAVKTFAPLAGRLVVPVIPGNHDEAVRRVTTRADDSWALDAASAVADALEMAPEGYQHVSFVFPKKDELTVTLDIAGTGVGLAHGHQYRAGQAHKWWADQAHGCQPIGDPYVKLLLTGHLHHLRVEQTGAKTWIQAPALDGGSAWWVQKTGQDCPPGLVTLCVGNGSWGDMAVL